MAATLFFIFMIVMSCYGFYKFGLEKSEVFHGFFTRLIAQVIGPKATRIFLSAAAVLAILMGIFGLAKQAGIVDSLHQTQTLAAELAAQDKVLDSTRTEMRTFVKHFTKYKGNFFTDGEACLTPGHYINFPDSDLIHRGDYRFFADDYSLVPDSFYPAVYFDFQNFYVCMVRGFYIGYNSETYDKNSSSLLILHKETGQVNVLTNCTRLHPMDCNRKCWIQAMDADTIPLVITGSLETENVFTKPLQWIYTVYVIDDGKFVREPIKIDTSKFVI